MTPGRRDACLLLGSNDGISLASIRKILAAWDPCRQDFPPSGHFAPDIEKMVNELLSRQWLQSLKKIKSVLKKLSCQWVTLADEDYPPLLREIVDPPPVLFFKGDLISDRSPAIAIVGSRKASPYGLRTASALGADLAGRGWPVVSGMAYGVDAAAHRGALNAGGRTVAVLGSGLDQIYPSSHYSLAEKISAAGAVVSEFPPGTPPRAANFPRRNRIISGISWGVVVVEAGEKSGSLITARMAAEQGREVMAVPGPVDSPWSRGCHLLLRQGAVLVEKGEDIVGQWPYLNPCSEQRGGFCRQDDPVAEFLSAGPMTAEELSGVIDIPLPEVLALLGKLELAGAVVLGVGGKYYSKGTTGRGKGD